VSDDATLALSAGIYDISVLKLGDRVHLAFDITAGPITINVEEELKMGEDLSSEITPLGPAGSKFVTINVLSSSSGGGDGSTVVIEEGSQILAQIVAPTSTVILTEEIAFVGTIVARVIKINGEDVSLMHPSFVEVTGAASKGDLLAADDAESEELPEEFELQQNYPNPFNPSTTLEYALPEASQVRMAVYDAIGREVAVLVDGSVAAGRHSVVWDARNLPSGTYIVRMIAGRFTRVKLVVLAK